MPTRCGRKQALPSEAEPRGKKLPLQLGQLPMDGTGGWGPEASPKPHRFWVRAHSVQCSTGPIRETCNRPVWTIKAHSLGSKISWTGSWWTSERIRSLSMYQLPTNCLKQWFSKCGPPAASGSPRTSQKYNYGGPSPGPLIQELWYVTSSPGNSDEVWEPPIETKIWLSHDHLELGPWTILNTKSASANIP